MKKTPHAPKTISFFTSKGYPETFRKDVHELVAFGYEKIQNEINSKSEETLITIRLAQVIWDGLDRLDELPDSILKKRYFVTAERPQIAQKDPKNIKDTYIRFDVQIFDTQMIPRLTYCIEAKRLRKNGFAIGKYCDEGMLRFINQTYCSEAPEALMIAFWQDGTEKYWKSELRRRFKEDTSGSLAIVKTLATNAVISKFSNELASVHRRESNNNLVLYHLFLPCLDPIS